MFSDSCTMSPKAPPLDPGSYFHIYNRGNNRQCIFHTASDYDLFLRLWERFVHPVAQTLALDILPNHFHSVVRIRETPLGFGTEELLMVTSELVVKSLSKLFNSFARTMHNLHGTEGAVFKSPFQRKLIDSDGYLKDVLAYVILNAFRHGIVSDYRTYAYSSLSQTAVNFGFVDTNALLELFGGAKALDAYLDAAMRRPFKEL